MLPVATVAYLGEVGRGEFVALELRGDGYGRARAAQYRQDDNEDDGKK